MNINRHKVFISYYHNEDQSFKEKLIRMTYFNNEKFRYESIFDDYSVGIGDIDDRLLTDEQIRRKIRDEYIKNATVLILLCGQKTKTRKHVDWEIHAAMYNSEANPKMGILVINLPTINQCFRSSSDDEKQLIKPYYTNWYSIVSRSEYEEKYPYMPERILDNFEKGIKISVVEWSEIENNPEKLMKLIDNAFNYKDENNYDHSRPLRGRNS